MAKERMQGDLVKADLEAFKDAMWEAGYTEFTVFHNGLFGLQVNVSQEIDDDTGWTALWGICKKFGIAGGGGGALYHQIKRGSLPVGIYRRENGRNS